MALIGAFTTCNCRIPAVESFREKTDGKNFFANAQSTKPEWFLRDINLFPFDEDAAGPGDINRLIAVKRGAFLLSGFSSL